MQHYLHIVVKPFFPDILKTMLSGSVKWDSIKVSRFNLYFATEYFLVFH